MQAPDLDRFLPVALAAADAAGAVIRPFFRGGFDVERKSDESPVTTADRAGERAMRAVLEQHLPDHGILGEEYGETRPDARFVWVLDPIDGTKAFITGRPIYGSLVALIDRERGGRPVLGLISQPTLGERWIGLDGRPTRFEGPIGGAELPRTRPCPRLADAEFAATAPDIGAPAEQARAARVAARARTRSWGGDCYIHGLLALGLIDLIVESGYKIWDWSALVPVVEGAGGRITDWAGRGLDASSDGSILALGDARLHEEVLSLLSEAPR